MVVTCIDRCWPDIVTKTPASFPKQEMMITTTETGAERSKTDVEMTYLKKKNIH